MALLVEDGTGVVDAESYVSVTDFRTWATKRSYTLPAGDTDVEALLRKGVDFIERKQFLGTIEFTDQGLAFPRLIQDADGVAVSTGIPKNLVTAQMMLALECMNGPLTAAARANKYTATKIDAIYLKYDRTANGSGDLFFPAIDELLKPWLYNSGTSIVTVRA